MNSTAILIKERFGNEKLEYILKKGKIIEREGKDPYLIIEDKLKTIKNDKT